MSKFGAQFNRVGWIFFKNSVKIPIYEMNIWKLNILLYDNNEHFLFELQISDDWANDIEVTQFQILLLAWRLWE